MPDPYLDAVPPTFGDPYLDAPRQWMDQARQQAARSLPEAPGVLETVRQRSAPFLSAIAGAVEEGQVGGARRRVEQGTADPQDYHTIAGHERLQELESQGGLGRRIVTGLAGAGALIGEAAATGGLAGATELPSLFSRAWPAAVGRAAVQPGTYGRLAARTAATPSLYLEQTARRNVEAGRDATDWRGLPPEFAHAMLANAVLGSLGHAGNSITGSGILPVARRVIARTSQGMVEQQGIDALSGAVSEILPEAMQLSPAEGRYGRVGDILRAHRTGNYDPAVGNALVEAVTFAAFGLAHERGEPPAAREAARRRALEELNARAERILGRPGREASLSTLTGEARQAPPERGPVAPEAQPSTPSAPPEPEHPVQAAARRMQEAEAGMAQVNARYEEMLRAPRPRGEEAIRQREQALDALREEAQGAQQARDQAREALAASMRQGRPQEAPGRTETAPEPRLGDEEVRQMRGRFDALGEAEIREAANAPAEVVNREFQRWSDEAQRLLRSGVSSSHEGFRRAQQLASLYLWAAQHEAARTAPLNRPERPQPAPEPAGGPEPSPGAPEAAAGQPEAPRAPSDPVERAGRAFQEQFPGAGSRGEAVRAEEGGYWFELQQGESPNSVRIDFARLDGQTGRNVEMKPGDESPLPKVRNLINRLAPTGVPIEYVAVEGRHRGYARYLERAGYEQVSGPTGEGGELRVWRPRQEAPAAPAPQPQPARPREPVARTPAEFNAKTWYHGTGTEGVTRPSIESANHENLFGIGLYLTDNPDVARSYAGKRGRKTRPVVYEAGADVRSVLDLEQPAPEPVRRVFEEYARRHPDRPYSDLPYGEELAAALARPGATVEQLFAAFRRDVANHSHANEVSTHEYDHDFFQIGRSLLGLGYDALTHTGGLRVGRRTGGPEHQVLIVLDPEEGRPLRAWHEQGTPPRAPEPPRAYTPYPPAPQAETPPAAPQTTAQVPVMVTQAMRATLRGRGYSEQAINAMRPQEAWDRINAGTPPPSPQERMLRRGRQDQPTPTVQPAEAEVQRLRRMAQAGDRVEIEQFLGAAGLSPEQTEFARRLAEGQSLQEAGEAMGLQSRQRAHQIAADLHVKLNLPEGVSLVDYLQGGKKGLLRPGDAIPPEEMEGARRRARMSPDERGARARALDTLAEQLLKESERGPLSDERRAWYASEGRRRAGLDPLPPGGAPAGQRGQPAPVRREAVEPGGAEPAAAPPPSEGGQEPVRAEAPQGPAPAPGAAGGEPAGATPGAAGSRPPAGNVVAEVLGRVQALQRRVRTALGAQNTDAELLDRVRRHLAAYGEVREETPGLLTITVGGHAGTAEVVSGPGEPPVLALSFGYRRAGTTRPTGTGSELPKQVQPGSTDFYRNLDGFLKKLAAEGVGVTYSAEERRLRTYDRLMRRNGFELQPGEGDPVWLPGHPEPAPRAPEPARGGEAPGDVLKAAQKEFADAHAEASQNPRVVPHVDPVVQRGTQSGVSQANAEVAAEARAAAPGEPLVNTPVGAVPASLAAKLGYGARPGGAEPAAAGGPPGGFGRPVAPEEGGMPGGGQPGGGQPGAGETRQPPTALANAVMEAERRRAGREQLAQAARLANPTVWDEALRTVQADPQAPDRLIDRLTRNPNSTTTVQDNALLLQRKVALRNEYERTVLDYLRAGQEGADAVTVTALERREAELTRQIDQLDRVTKSTGTEWGRAGQFRRQLAEMDYSLGGLLMRARAAYGRPLEPPEIANLERIARRIETAEGQLRTAEEGMGGLAGAGPPGETPRQLTTRVADSPEVRTLTRARTESGGAQGEADRFLEAGRRARLPVAEKTQNLLVRLYRAFLLSNPITVAKLSAAGAERMVSTPLEEGVGAVLSRLPGLSRIAALAPREGRGFNAAAEAKALGRGLYQGAIDAFETLRTGQSELEREQKVPVRAVTRVDRMLDLPGLIHAALKAPVKRNEYTRSYLQRMEHEAAQGRDVTSPAAQAQLAALAYQDANRAIFQGDNRVVDAWKRAIASLRQPGASPGARALATGMELAVPIVRVPTNIVAETLQYAFGSVTGSVRAGIALRRGAESLKPAEADLIMRQLKKGSLGLAVMALGYFVPGLAGGFYSGRRKPGDEEAGSVAGAPPFLAHHPLLEAMQIGASTRRVQDEYRGSRGAGAALGALEGARGLVREVPFVRSAEEYSRLASTDPRERGRAFGEIAKSFAVPQLFQWLAGRMDTEGGVLAPAVRRSPRDFGERLEMGVPGMRQNVPAARR